MRKMRSCFRKDDVVVEKALLDAENEILLPHSRIIVDAQFFGHAVQLGHVFGF